MPGRRNRRRAQALKAYLVSPPELLGPPAVSDQGCGPLEAQLNGPRTRRRRCVRARFWRRWKSEQLKTISPSRGRPSSSGQGPGRGPANGGRRSGRRHRQAQPGPQLILHRAQGVPRRRRGAHLPGPQPDDRIHRGQAPRRCAQGQALLPAPALRPRGADQGKGLTGLRPSPTRRRSSPTNLLV